MRRPRGFVSAERGFSMVELMVAVTLALVVTAAVLSVFVASRSSYQRTAGTASLADSGRFALDFIQASVRSAGYMACNTSLRQLSMLNPGPTPLYYNFTQALAGYEATGTAGTGAYTVPASSPANKITPDASAGDWVGGLDGALTGKVIKNNDVLAVYSTLANSQSVYVTSIVDGAATFTVNAQGNLAAGGNQLIAISDCAKSAVMWSSLALTGAAPSITVTHDTTGGVNSTSVLPASFQVGSQVAPVDTVVYYIGQGEDGDGALFSYDLNAGATFTANELVPDIEAMQVLYGVDTQGNQTVTDYVSADAVPVVAPGGWNSVISVKVAILAASELNAVQPPTAATTYNLLGTTVTAPLDTRARQVFEMTIGIRNLAP